ncbi:MAG TPA: acyl-CoA dehydrogenase family protein [Vicinamibacterales bacterium]|jgi:alkylation response protein AidB-like acyl-CoA dehydrogenase|nr:acyl-CoA dehydrogenase family protein [Vicinamibacterales bacterium]
MATSASAATRGGEWLISPGDPATVFSPERLNEEQRMIAQTVTDFVDNEVLPVLDRLEQKDWALARDLVKRAGALGLLGVDVPEEFGGLALDKITSMLVSERISRSASFGATFGAQANLMILPLTLFGSEAQKQQYLPQFLSGELIGAYCLSEPGSGSDALGAKTRAVRQPDGSFVLNGEKAWITNGGFADVYIVFGKVVDSAGEHFSAFIVERAFKGVSNGKEEHKMGLHGSSTTPVILQDVRVPAANLLGEVGRGHKIAFNVLNFARFKLGAMCVGGARGAIAEAAAYAADRRQFGQPIANFGAIKHKLGEMIARAYAVESLIYRTAGSIEARIQATPHAAGDQSAALAALEEFAMEASIAKVAGSEMLDYVLDENIQIHGGNGYVRDYPAERHYRDSRVNRIFEGTNEINRLLIPGILARRAAKGDSALVEAARALQSELSGSSASPSAPSSELPVPDALKKTALLTLGLAMQRYKDTFGDQQEVLIQLADIIIDAYAAESAVLRAKAVQAAARTSTQTTVADLQADAARVYADDAAMRVQAAARRAIASMLDGDALRLTLGALRRLTAVPPVDTIQLRRRLADEAVRRRAYPF